MKTIKNIALYLWQLPQNLLGLIFWAIYSKGHSYLTEHDNRVIIDPRFYGGISLGRYILMVAPMREC